MVKVQTAPGWREAVGDRQCVTVTPAIEDGLFHAMLVHKHKAIRDILKLRIRLVLHKQYHPPSVL